MAKGRPPAAATAGLEERLGHRFREPALLREALRHRSHRSVQTGRERDNQRLEFLGDRVLGLVVAADIFAACPEAREGELHAMLECRVRRSACADAARRAGLGPHLILSGVESRSGLRELESVLADAFEAVLAAVYVDGGLEAAAAMARRLLAAEEEGPTAAHPRSRLQEWSLARGLGLPDYRTEAGSCGFRSQVRIGDGGQAAGSGPSKRAAETAAAAALLAICAEAE